MKTYSIELLRQHIYDYGMEKTCQILGLTPIKARKILHGGKISQKDYSTKETNKNIDESMKPIDYKNINIQALYRVFSNNFIQLEAKFNSRNDVKKLDVNGLTIEDKFQDAFLKLLEKEFTFIDDVQTITYIEKHLFFYKKTAKHNHKKNNKKFLQFDDNYGTNNAA